MVIVRHTPASPLEAVEQALFVQRLRTDPRCRLLLWTATANGGKRHLRTAAALKKQGVVAGVPDLLFFEPSGARVHGLAIEMKRRPNRPTAEQRDWLAGLDARGWSSHVCYSAEEAWTVLTDYLGWATP